MEGDAEIEQPEVIQKSTPLNKIKGGTIAFFKVFGFFKNFNTPKRKSRAKIVFLPFSFFEMKYLIEDFDSDVLENRISIGEVKKFLSDVYEITRDYKKIRNILTLFGGLRTFGALLMLISVFLVFIGIAMTFSSNESNVLENYPFLIGLGIFCFTAIFLIVVNIIYNLKINKAFKEYEKRTRIVIRRYNGKYVDKGIFFRMSKTEGLSVIEIIATYSKSNKQKDSNRNVFDEEEMEKQTPTIPHPNDITLESEEADTKKLKKNQK